MASHSYVKRSSRRKPLTGLFHRDRPFFSRGEESIDRAGKVPLRLPVATLVRGLAHFSPLTFQTLCCCILPSRHTAAAVVAGVKGKAVHTA